MLLQDARHLRVALIAFELTLDHLLSLFFQRQRVLERWDIDVLEQVARRGRRAARAGSAARHDEDSLVGVKCRINESHPESVPRWCLSNVVALTRQGDSKKGYSGVTRLRC